MAKSGLDYFPLACTFDDRIQLIEAEFGNTGFAIVVKLFQKIYGECGYYSEWNDEVALLFSRKVCGISQGDHVVSEVVKAALKRGIFSKELFEKYGILSSPGIQKRYFEAAKRRAEIEVERRYLLIDVTKIKTLVYINEKNVCKNSKNVCKISQRKVKESKGNNIKPIVSEKENVFFDDDSLNDSFLKFIEMRRSDKKHPFTEYAANLAKSKIKALATANGVFDSEKARAIIEQSILNGWKGFFELKDGGGVTKAKPSSNKFTNINQRTYDYNSLEKAIYKSNGAGCNTRSVN